MPPEKCIVVIVELFPASAVGEWASAYGGYGGGAVCETFPPPVVD